MLLGKIMAEAAMRENKFVTWLPAYGAEVRGGAAYCMVIISDKEIGSPCIDKADTLIIMNNPSLQRFKNRLKHKGLFIINSSLTQGHDDIRAVKHPFSDIALRLGNIRIANMIILGCYLVHKKALDIKTVLKVVEEFAPPDKKGLIAINQRALKEGYGLNDKG